MRRLIILAAMAVAVVAPASAQAAKPSYYLSLGDSLAAGYNKDAKGVTRYSAKDYTARVLAKARKRDKHLRLARFACPGEDTTSMQVDLGCPLPRSAADDTAQLKRAVRFLKAHKGHVKLVTVSIGANNFTRCTPGGQIDLACITNGVDRLKTDLPKIFRSLRKAAGPKTRMAALQLYDPYLSYWLQGDSGQTRARQADALVRVVNGDIATAAKPYKLRLADGYDAFHAGVFDKSTTYNGQSVPVAVAENCRLSQNCLPAPQGNIHPTSAGYAALAVAFERSLGLRH